ncbi:fibronectin type III domain-containing protein [Paenibacillus glycanilyticus]|uniref:fibronectin type III domain-containing protein n=1 Tax=Paenibacillus glycanilyticus TaxID=126569 RepID=UPI00203E8D66|nr:fibronectin type III domain-containing protein [Paenibacillus glycanilyticus]MCM3626749.1 fibronectin type III domain-containing protein [Paenibacillus glycanilyticus]
MKRSLSKMIYTAILIAIPTTLLLSSNIFANSGETNSAVLSDSDNPCLFEGFNKVAYPVSQMNLNNENIKKPALKEIEDQRTEFTKTFLSNNSYITTTSTSPQHYYEEGKWKDINTSITYDSQTKNYRTSGREITTNFSSQGAPEIKVNSKDYQFVYKPQNANVIEPSVFNDTIIYGNLWDGTDLIYTSNYDNLLLSLKLNGPNAPQKYVFTLNSTGTTPVMDSSGNISFYDENNEKIFNIPKIGVREISNNASKSYDGVSMNLSKVDDTWEITITVNDKDLSYPLLLETTTVVQSSWIYTTNKNYFPLPSMQFNEVKSIAVCSQSGDYNHSVNIPAELYLAYNTVPSEEAFGCCSLRPGEDGITVMNVGTVNEFDGENSTFYSDSMSPPLDERLYNECNVQLNCTIKGVALYHPDWYNYFHTEEVQVYHEALPPPILPATPQNLRTSNVTTNSVDLEWDYATNTNITDYTLYINGSSVYTINLPSTAIRKFTVGDLSPSTAYTFNISARDKSLQDSTLSNAVTINTKDRFKSQYFYDAAGRLDYIQLSTGKKIKYNYDSNGNLVSTVLQ